MSHVIPKRLRIEVWEHRIGKKYEGKCSVTWCKNKIQVLGTWHVGHNISIANGGQNTLDNLFPLCSECNLSMSTKSIDEFNKILIPSKKKRCCFC